ncbi:MAG: glycosyltransferase [Leptolyngbyaceae cyanobacterium]
MSAQPTRILQIVPRMSPDVDGVGDYALQLAHELCDLNQIHSDFLVVRPHPQRQSQVDRFSVHSLDSHTVQGVLQRVPDDISTIFLQYSNYPYLQGKLDAPMWLADALNVLKQRGLRIVVMFHELPTLRYKRIRCPNFLQRRVSRRLAQIADVVVTNNTAFQQTLAQWAQVYCVPNFSTIGEAATVKPLAARKRSLVVFGSSDRTRVYRNNIETINCICNTLAIDTLYDVGRPVDWDHQGINVKVVRTGFLSATDISQLLAESLAGVFDYRRFPQNLAKSTVYAAYCSHGMVPICNAHGLKPQDNIAANHHYLVSSNLKEFAQPSTLQVIADNAYAHYQTRTLAQCARRFAELINPVQSAQTVNTDLYTKPEARV